MVSSRSPVSLDPGETVAPAVTGVQSARYTHDMLDTLSRIALRHEQVVLARLLEAAASEAGRLAQS